MAPITLQSQSWIENGDMARDDRKDLLGQEYLKFCYSRLLSPNERSRATVDARHPLWLSFIQDMLASKYVFQQIPPGLTNTAQLHIRQAATSIGNLWSGTIYEKSFKHLVMNALRLRLAPERFRRQQERSQKPATVPDESNDARGMPRSRWSYLVTERFDELAQLCYRDDISDRRTHNRMQGIMASLGRLKALEHKSKEPSYIPKLSVQQEMAVSKASGDCAMSDIGMEDEIRSIDDDDDDDDKDGEWAPDDEYDELATDEFDGRDHPPSTRVANLTSISRAKTIHPLNQAESRSVGCSQSSRSLPILLT